jgi:hypothetical protein
MQTSFGENPMLVILPSHGVVEVRFVAEQPVFIHLDDLAETPSTYRERLYTERWIRQECLPIDDFETDRSYRAEYESGV